MSSTSGVANAASVPEAEPKDEARQSAVPGRPSPNHLTIRLKMSGLGVKLGSSADPAHKLACAACR